MVVAVKLNIIEGCGDAIPAGHGCGFCPADIRHRYNDDVSESQGFADQHNLKLNRHANSEVLGAQKIDSCRADIASDQGYRRFLGHSAGAAKAQREF